MRKEYVIGNWKMNKNIKEGIDFIHNLMDLIKKIKSNANVIIAPPFIHLSTLNKLTKETPINIAAQNCSSKDKGAYTGEISAEMVFSTGTEFIILGHSERRNYHQETDNLLSEKVKRAISNSLSVIFCIGESLNQRELNNHFKTIDLQLEKGLFHLSKNYFKKIIIAYEPVWAIGTGVTATPEQAQEMHAYIRKSIAKKYDNETAANTSILYGGSCNPSNAKELFFNKDVDGGLIGGASLNPNDFVEIVNSF